MAKQTLLNSSSPLHFFSESYLHAVTLPRLHLQRTLQAEHAAKELAIIAALDRERASAQYAHDVRVGLLHMNKFTGKPAREDEGQTEVLMDSDGLPTQIAV